MALFALFLTTFVSGCSESIKGAIRPVLPEMPAETASPCVDPGVAKDSNVALIETRVAWATCFHKHKNAVDFYSDVKGGYQ